MYDTKFYLPTNTLPSTTRIVARIPSKCSYSCWISSDKSPSSGYYTALFRDAELFRGKCAKEINVPNRFAILFSMCQV